MSNPTDSYGFCMWDVYLNTHFSAHLMMSSIPHLLCALKMHLAYLKKKYSIKSTVQTVIL